jgi:hypothetical protein
MLVLPMRPWETLGEALGTPGGSRRGSGKLQEAPGGSRRGPESEEFYVYLLEIILQDQENELYEPLPMICLSISCFAQVGCRSITLLSAA